MSAGEGSKSIFWTAVAFVYAILILFPMLWMAAMMVKPTEAMFARPTILLFTPTLDHFGYVLAQGFHWNLLTSFVLCAVSTGLIVLIGTPAAYAFARFEMKAKDDLFLFILASRMAPPVCLVIPKLITAQGVRWGEMAIVGMVALLPIVAVDDAAKQAVREMVKHVCARTNLSRNQAYMLCSLAGNLRVTQTVDGNKGVHMLLEKALI